MSTASKLDLSKSYTVAKGGYAEVHVMKGDLEIGVLYASSAEVEIIKQRLLANTEGVNRGPEIDKKR